MSGTAFARESLIRVIRLVIETYLNSFNHITRALIALTILNDSNELAVDNSSGLDTESGSLNMDMRGTTA